VKTLVLTPETAPVVEGPRQGEWTYTDWENLLDDGNRYEIIDGYIYMTTAPSNFHQWIIGNFYDVVGVPAKNQGLGYPFLAPIGLLMPGCDPVQPDFLFVRKANKAIIYDRRIRGVPDLIIEVLSPGSIDYDEDVKLKSYARAGVPEYVVIDPLRRALRLYALDHPGQYAEAHEFSGDSTVKLACLPSIEFRLSSLFENAPDTTV